MTQDLSTKQPDATDDLEIIREEQCSTHSSVNMDSQKAGAVKDHGIEQCTDCACPVKKKESKEKLDPKLVKKLLLEKEKKLTAEFQERMEKEIKFLKERCDFILQNEQVRASYMLREAHRERQEKITALQIQLECKNMAGLMYVMCTERRKSKLEKMRIQEEFTNYINTLQDILSEAQTLILHLSRGYKTASRIDHEWREKMKNVLSEFQSFVHDFAGGAPEGNQYFFNIPALLHTKGSITDDPNEDPCESDDNEETERNVIEEEDMSEKPWWESMDTSCRPFVMLGDMAEFKPPQRREVLHALKAAKTAPRKWKEYVFNQMSLKASCENADVIKDKYPKYLPTTKWECRGQPEKESSKTSLTRRATRPSEDIRGNMGSILKIMTSSNKMHYPITKATLLGARDSMEIQSTTRLRGKQKHAESKVVINVAHRRTSFYDDVKDGDEVPDKSKLQSNDDMDEADELSALGSVHNDSLHMIPNHVPEADHKINYEKICPMEKCKRLKTDSFIRSLPVYMQANPFTHFEQNFEEYETCSPEQLEILKKRIASKEKGVQEPVEECPLAEWSPSVGGVAAQTSELSVSLPPCHCRAPSCTPVSSNGRIFSGKERDVPWSKGPFSTVREKSSGVPRECKSSVGSTTPISNDSRIFNGKGRLSLGEKAQRRGGLAPNISNDGRIFSGKGGGGREVPKQLSVERMVISATSVTSNSRTFNVADLFPIKEALDIINKECLYDDRVEFNRFKVLGQESNSSIKTAPKKDNRSKVQEVTKILKEHPSLLDIFQSNTQ